MTEYEIEANTRRCAVSGRQLQPGEKYFSVLLDLGGKFQRRDYSCEAWQGPPEGAFSFWAGRIAAADENRPKIDDEMLLDCFQRLEGDDDPGRVNFRLHCRAAPHAPQTLPLRMRHARKGIARSSFCAVYGPGQRHRVINPLLTEEQMAAVQEEVFKVLGWQ